MHVAVSVQAGPATSGAASPWPFRSRRSRGLSWLVAAGAAVLAPAAAASHLFGTASTVSTGASATGHVLHAVDVDADGILDLVWLSGTNLAVNPGLGGGLFAGTRTFATGVAAPGTRLAVGDVTGDGSPDVVVGCSAGTRAALMVNSGGGTFASAPIALPRPSGREPHLADVDADGDLDVLLAGTGVTVLRNAGGALAASSDAPGTVSLGETTIAVGDLDGDGRTDAVATALDGADGIDVLWAGVDPLTLQAGIAQVARTTTTLQAGASIALGDLDADGDLDVVLHGTIVGSTEAALRVLRNDGARRLTPSELAASAARPGGTPSIVVVDLDADGDADVLVGCGADTSCRMLLRHDGDGTGRLSDVAPVGAVAPARRLATADLDCDGRPDVVASGVGILALDSEPSGFIDELSLTEGGDDFVLADFDADGQVDVASLDASELAVARGVGCSGGGTSCAGTEPLARAGADRMECVTPGGVSDIRITGGGSVPNPASPIGRYCWRTDNGFFLESQAPFECSALSGVTLRLPNLASGARATVTLEIADLAGCRSTDEVVVATETAPLLISAGTTRNLQCAGVAFDMQARASHLGSPTGLVRYEWDLDVARDTSGDTVADNDVDATVTGVSNALAVVRATYSQPGTFTARVTVRQAPDGACTNVAHVTVTVAAPPEVTSVSGPVNACPGEPARFRALVTGGTAPVAITWDFDSRVDVDGNGNPGDDIEAIGEEIDWVFVTGGARDVRATARAAGACTDSLARAVNVYPPPTAAFTTSIVSCELSLVTLTDASTGTAPLLSFWDFGDGQTAAGATQSHLYAGPGAYVVTHSIVDGFGCEATVVQPVFVGRSSLDVAGVTVLDGVGGQGSGNGNGFPDPGETVRLQLDVANGGLETVADAVAQLSLASAISGVTISRPTAVLPLLGPGDVVSTFPPHLEVTIASNVPCGTPLPLRIGIGSAGSCATTVDAGLLVGLPSLLRYHPDGRVTFTAEESETPDMAFGGGQHFTVYADRGEGVSQVLLARHLSAGTFLEPTTRLSAVGIPSDQPQVAWAAEVAQFAATWRESFGDAQGQVAFSRLSSDGRTVGTPLRFTVGGAASSPDVTWTGETWVVAWSERTTQPASAEIWAMAIGANGLPLTQPQRVSPGEDVGIAYHEHVRLASSGGTWAAAFTRTEGPDRVLLARTFDASPGAAFAALATVTIGDSADEPAALAALSSGYLLAWSDRAAAVKVSLLDALGAPRVTEPVGPGRTPALAVGSRHAVVAWSQGDEILARGVARTGAVFASPLAVSAGDGPSTTPALSAAADGLFLASWNDRRPPHPDAGEIYAGVIQPGLPEGCTSGTLGDLAPIPAGDGDINVGDVVVALRMAVGSEPVTADALSRGDVAPGSRTGSVFRAVGNGAMDIGDVVVLLQAATGQITLVR